MEFAKIMDYLDILDNSIDPDYEYIEELFYKMAKRERIKVDMKFNWDDL